MLLLQMVGMSEYGVDVFFIVLTFISSFAKNKSTGSELKYEYTQIQDIS